MNVINSLNRKLFFKFNKIKVQSKKKEEKPQTVEEYLSNTFQMHYHGDKPTATGNQIDVPNVSAVDNKYTTHKQFFQPEKKTDREKDQLIDLDGEESNESDESDDEIREQEEGEAEVPAPTEVASDEIPPEEGGPNETPEMGDPGLGMDVGDPGMPDPTAGMPGMEEPKDPTELGRTYEMKKIYARLVSMNQYLADERSMKILRTKQNIAKAIDLFAVIGANPDSYKEKIDEIIVGYYKFLEAAYRKVKSFYKKKAKEVGGRVELEDNEEQNSERDTEDLKI